MAGSSESLTPKIFNTELVEKARNETTGEAIFLTLRPTVPWQSSISLGTDLSEGSTGTRVVDVGGTRGLSVDDGTPEDPTSTLTWDLPSGQTAMLWGSGSTEDWVELAENLETASATDPQIVDHLNQRPPFRGR